MNLNGNALIIIFLFVIVQRNEKSKLLNVETAFPCDTEFNFTSRVLTKLRRQLHFKILLLMQKDSWTFE